MPTDHPSPASVGTALLALAALLPCAAAQSTLLAWSGDYHGAEFGTVLTYGADIDGDGTSDIFVGCPEDDTNGEDAGAAYIHSGSDGTLLRSHFGSAAGDRFGSSFASFKDINLDGVSDYAIGAPFADGNGADAGRVRTYSGMTGLVLSTIDGLAAGDRFGAAMTALSPFYFAPNDPSPKVGLAIGAPYADGFWGSDTGAIYIRTPSGAPFPVPPTVREGIQANEHYGSAIESSFSAMIVGAPDYDSGPTSNVGRYEAWNVYTFVSTATMDYLWSVVGSAAGGRLGTAVAIVGWPDPTLVFADDEYAAGAPSASPPYVDVSNDHSGSSHHLATLTGSGNFGSAIASVSPGYTDPYTAIGAPELIVGGVPRGRVTFYQAGAVDHVVDGLIPGERLGAALASGGTDSFLLGAPAADGAVPDAGLFQLYVAGQFEFEVTAPASDGDRAGSAVAGIGDINADGVPDVLVGSPDDDASVSFPLPGERIDCGSARVLSGATGAVLRTHLGGADGDHLGTSVAALGDINLDGVTDYVIGAPQTDNTSTKAGYAIAVSGLTGSTLFTFTGVFNTAEFGAAVGGGSDVNGDGRFDILVGSPGTTNGAVTAYSGVNGAQLGVVNGAKAGDRFGAAVAGLGADLNGDGRQEYVVGAPGADFLSTPDAGIAYLMRSISSLLVINSAISTNANDHLGTSVAAAGDVNKDGIADYIVGVPGYDSPFANSGRANVMSGAGGIAQQLWVVTGSGPGDDFGTSVAGLGDVNGDGFPDWAAGAPEPGIILGSSGYVKVISGKDQSQLSLITGSGGDALGTAIAAAGDVDLDGVRDLLVGAPLNDAQGINSGYARAYSLASGLPVWTNLGFALAGSAGPPSLAGTGSLLTGTPGAITLTGAKPSAAASLFISLSNVPTPFKGGTLVPIPPLLTLVLATSPAGDLPLAWPAWPAGLSGFSVYFQYAIQDAVAVHGAALSNALRGAVP